MTVGQYKKIFLMGIYGFFLNASFATAKITDWSSKLSNSKGGELYGAGAGGGSSADVAKFIGTILVMGPFLGIPFIIHMVMAGYEWMTAAGDAKKVEDAKKRITNAVIGLALFISLYILAYFIIKSLGAVTEYGV